MGGHSHHVHVQPQRAVILSNRPKQHTWRNFFLILLVVSAIIAVWQWVLLTLAVVFFAVAFGNWVRRR